MQEKIKKSQESLPDFLRYPPSIPEQLPGATLHRQVSKRKSVQLYLIRRGVEGPLMEIQVLSKLKAKLHKPIIHLSLEKAIQIKYNLRFQIQREIAVYIAF